MEQKAHQIKQQKTWNGIKYCDLLGNLYNGTERHPIDLVAPSFGSITQWHMELKLQPEYCNSDPLKKINWYATNRNKISGTK